MLCVPSVQYSSSLFLTLLIASPFTPKCVFIQMINCVVPYTGPLGKLEKQIKLPETAPCDTHRSALTRGLSSVTTVNSRNTPQICPVKEAAADSKTIFHGLEREPPSQPLPLATFTPSESEFPTQTSFSHVAKTR